MVKLIQSTLICVVLAFGVNACAPAPESGRGFRLPDGEPDIGRQVFVDMACNACHTIPGVELPSSILDAPVAVVLGGPVARVQNYGQLVTSIINPSHKLIKRYPEDEISDDRESLMPVLNHFMTVQQLIDVVAFLQDQYEVVVPESYPYSVYTYY